MPTSRGFSFWVEPALRSDVAEIFRLLHFKTSNELLIKLTAAQINKYITSFFVARSYYVNKHSNSYLLGSSSIVGCCAFFEKTFEPSSLLAQNNNFMTEQEEESKAEVKAEVKAESSKIENDSVSPLLARTAKNEPSVVPSASYYELRSVGVDARFQAFGVGRGLVAFGERATEKATRQKLSGGYKNKLLQNSSGYASEVSGIMHTHEMRYFCFSKRSSFFEKLGYKLTSWQNFEGEYFPNMEALQDPRYNKKRGENGVKVYCKKREIIF